VLTRALLLETACNFSQACLIVLPVNINICGKLRDQGLHSRIENNKKTLGSLQAILLMLPVPSHSSCVFFHSYFSVNISLFTFFNGLCWIEDRFISTKPSIT